MTQFGRPILPPPVKRVITLPPEVLNAPNPMLALVKMERRKRVATDEAPKADPKPKAVAEHEAIVAARCALILAAMKDGARTSREICKASGLSVSTMLRAMAILRAEGSACQLRGSYGKTYYKIGKGERANSPSGQDDAVFKAIASGARVFDEIMTTSGLHRKKVERCLLRLREQGRIKVVGLSGQKYIYEVAK